MGSLKFIKLAWKQFRERNGFSQYWDQREAATEGF